MNRHADMMIGTGGRPAGRRRGWTLIELLVVMGVIVLVIAMAVPIFGTLTGNRSIQGAQNQLAAVLSAARTEAMELQRYTGVMFFMDPATERMTMATVYGEEEGGPVVYLDAVADQEFATLPAGVAAQTLNSLSSDRYMGCTALFGSQSVPAGPVILFDGRGCLAAVRYGFRMGSGGRWTAVARLLNPRQNFAAPPPSDWPANAASAPVSQFGLVLFPLPAFRAAGYDMSDPQFGGVDPAGEEAWLESNAVPLLVNRYNGTLVRTE